MKKIIEHGPLELPGPDDSISLRIPLRKSLNLCRPGAGYAVAKPKPKSKGGKPNKDCDYWLRGNCIKGKDCTFAHDPAKNGSNLQGKGGAPPPAAPNAAPAQRGRQMERGDGRGNSGKKGKNISKGSYRSKSTGGRSLWSRRTSRSTEKTKGGKNKKRRYPAYG